MSVTEAGKPGTNWTQVTPEARRRVAPLVRHYMKMAHPFDTCVRDNTKRFGPERAKRVCAVVKDMGMRTTKWRKGPHKVTEMDVARAVARLILAGVRTPDQVNFLAEWLESQSAIPIPLDDFTFGERLKIAHVAEARLAIIERAGLLESDDADLRAETNELLLCVALADIPRHRDGKWTNLLSRITEPEDSGGEGGADAVPPPVAEAVIGGVPFDEKKHKRAAKGTAEGGRFVRSGSRGDLARAVQRKVGAAPDGLIGPKSTAAIRAFQEKHGLTVDGVVGHQTASALLGRKKKARVGALTASDRHLLRGRGKPERVTEGVIPLSRAELSKIASKRRRDPHGRFMEELKKLGPGGSFQVGNVRVAHSETRDPKKAGKKVPAYHITRSRSGERATERAIGKGEAMRKALDMSAADDHPESVGGKKVFSGYKDFARSTGVKGHQPHSHDDLEERGTELLGDGAWNRGLEDRVSKLESVGSASKPNGSTQSLFKKGGKLVGGEVQGGYYTPERLELHHAIARAFLQGIPSQEQPEALFMAGGPASGKSTMLRSGATGKPADSVLINPDAVKGMIPEYSELLRRKNPAASGIVHEESADIARLVVRLAQERRMNLTVDKTKIKPAEVKAFQAMGYRTRGAIATVEVSVARDRAKKRGDKSGRYVPDEILIPGHVEVAKKFEEWAKDSEMPIVLMDTGAGKVIATAESGSVRTVDAALYTRFKKRAETVD